LYNSLRLINGRAVRGFTKDWLNICEEREHHFITDAPSIAPNHPSFVEHRHDQAVFSLLIYLRPAAVIADETYWGNPPAWDANRHFPIHAIRLKF
jgi:hypothetical protein